MLGADIVITLPGRQQFMYALGFPYNRNRSGFSSNGTAETQRNYMCNLQTVNVAIFTLGCSVEVTLRLVC